VGNRGSDDRWVHRPPDPGFPSRPVRPGIAAAPRSSASHPSPTRSPAPPVRFTPRRAGPLLIGLVIGLTVGLLVGLAIGGTGGATGSTGLPSADRSAALTVAEPPVAATPTVLSSVGGSDGRWVALTFDDGPDSRYTPEVLALLKRHEAVATFCMVGDQIPGNEALIREVAAAGMALCSHTSTHDLELPGRPLEQIMSEIVGAQRDLAAAAGAPVNYYRAPGGNWSPTVLEVAATHGMQPLGWSVDTRDWTAPGVEAILDAVDRQLQPGGVILLHDGGGNRDQTLAALGVLLPRLIEQGYRFGFPAAVPPSA